MKQKEFIKISENQVMDIQTGEVIPTVNTVKINDYGNRFIGYDIFEKPKNPFDNNNW